MIMCHPVSASAGHVRGLRAARNDSSLRIPALPGPYAAEQAEQRGDFDILHATLLVVGGVLEVYADSPNCSCDRDHALNLHIMHAH